MDREYRNQLIGVVKGRGSGGPFSNGRDDWQRFYRYLASVQRGDPSRRPASQDIEDVLMEAMPERSEWIRELVTAYARGIDLLDYTSGNAAVGSH